MRMMNSAAALAALAIATVVTSVANPVLAFAADEPIAGYCLYFHENSIYYRTPVFRAAKFDRHRFVEDWKHQLFENGVSYYGGVTCRAWPGGADAVASASAAAGTPPEYTQRIVDIDWIPKDAVRASGGGNVTLPSANVRGTTTTAKTPKIRPAPSSLSPAPSKYVEVAGPSGTQRLSPEVAARNQAAADDYRRKMEEHARAKAAHERTLALHQQSIAAAAAEKQEYQRKIAQNAAQVASNETAYLEQRKATAKPLGVNAVYRGFTGRTCEQARSSAIRGSGTDKGSQFVEVTQDLSAMPRLCIVQGWSWTTSKTGSSRQ